MIIFDYKLCTAMEDSTFYESSGVKPICRYLEYTNITTMNSSSWELSDAFMMLLAGNYNYQWSSYLNAIASQTLMTGLVSFRHFTLSIATLQFIKFWLKLLIKVKVLICWPMGAKSLGSRSI